MKNNRKAKIKKEDISSKRRFSKITYKLKVGLKILVILLLAIFVFTPLFDQQKTKWSECFFNKTASYGLVLKKVIIEGNNSVNDEEIVKAIGSRKGDPILQLSLPDIKQKLEENEWVQSAVVERQLPSSLYVAIIEREAIAIWQFKNKLYLIDAEGMRIVPYSSKYNQNLIQVVGPDANIYANGLIQSLHACPPLEDRVDSAIRFGGRRWNLHFTGGLTTKMPEKDFDKAYDYLCKLHEKGKLFDQDFQMIDLRILSKIYVK